MKWFNGRFLLCLVGQLRKLISNFLSQAPATSWQRNCCRKVAEWCVKFLFAGTISTPLNLATKFSIVAKIRHLLVDKPHNYWGSKLKLFQRVNRSQKESSQFKMSISEKVFITLKTTFIKTKLCEEINIIEYRVSCASDHYKTCNMIFWNRAGRNLWNFQGWKRPHIHCIYVIQSRH